MNMSVGNDAHGIDLETYGIYNESRLLGEIPQYETHHQRHYFTDQSNYKKN